MKKILENILIYVVYKDITSKEVDKCLIRTHPWTWMNDRTKVNRWKIVDEKSPLGSSKGHWYFVSYIVPKIKNINIYTLIVVFKKDFISFVHKTKQTKTTKKTFSVLH